MHKFHLHSSHAKETYYTFTNQATSIAFMKFKNVLVAKFECCVMQTY